MIKSNVYRDLDIVGDELILLRRLSFTEMARVSLAHLFGHFVRTLVISQFGELRMPEMICVG